MYNSKRVQFTHIDAKKEWTALRNKYQKYKTKPRQPSGSGARRKQQPGLAEQLAGDLSFLDGHIGEHASSGGNLEDSDSDKSENSSASGHRSRSSAHSRSAARSRSSIRSSASNSVVNERAALIAYLEKETSKKEEDADVGWFRSLLPMLEKLSLERRLEWKTEVQGLLMRYTKTDSQPTASRFFESYNPNTPVTTTYNYNSQNSLAPSNNTTTYY